MPDGAIADVAVANGCYATIAPKLAPFDNDIDCAGKQLIPGLHDHHIHLFATAARLQSVDLSSYTNTDAIIAALRARAATLADGEWLRATGYDEQIAGIPDRHQLGQWLPHHRLRVQDRTGALWLLNSAGVEALGAGPWPESVETGADHLPTGRIWRGDDWLRQRIDSQVPSLAPLSQQLAHWGVTSVTDAGANNGPAEAAIFSAAIHKGELRQRLILMGREDLPGGPAYQLGPVKLLFDERALPDLDSIADRINAARRLGRTVAAHCVTEAELVTYLAALEQAGGAQTGDRIEHGSMIPSGLIAEIAAKQLTVVSNPGFIATRGDRYLAQMDLVEIADLQRLASLTASGVNMLAGSDAPYGPANPWAAMRAAMLRQTQVGAVLGADEAVDSDVALALFARTGLIAMGALADCCVVDGDWAQRLQDDAQANPVHLTLIGGNVT